MKILFRIKYILFLFAIAAISYNCAKIGSPNGGPKDTEPPKILESTPELKAINFLGKKINIRFNEYIQINTLQTSFVISPPLKEKPEFKLKGKSLVIDLNNTLRDSMTYTLSFGDGIADLNENNPIKNFQFVFSTGPELDSLRITGTVLDAYTLQPVDGGLIMLYFDVSDSAPRKNIPLYLDKLNKTGSFSLNNLKQGTYKMYAMKDANNDMKFNRANEKFGFLDSVLTPTATVKQVTDTLKDIKKKDSLVTKMKTDFFPKDIKIRIFEEDNKPQFLSNNDRPEKVKCVFTFNKPLDKNLEIIPLNFSQENPWFIMEKSRKNDTVVCWMKDTIIGNIDTMKLELKYNKLDSLGELKLFSDTVKLKIKSKIISKGKPTPKLSLKHNIGATSILDLNVPITFDLGHPVLAYDTSFIKLFTVKDSVLTPQIFSLTQDTAARKLIDSNPRKFNLEKKWDETKSYKLKVFPCAFSDIYDNTNDTLLIDFKIQKENYYGSLALSMKNVTCPVIVLWMDFKEAVISQTVISADKIIKYDFQKPQKYKLKVIYDTNNNGIWDTGKYSEKRQPEKVLYYKTEIEIKSNWAIEQDWTLE